MRLLVLLIASLAPACASPVEPPAVEASPLVDTADTRGPYGVAARVSSTRPIAAVELVWHDLAAAQGSVRAAMVRDDAGVWRAGIPGHGRGARIAYHVEARTEDGDRGYDPLTAGTGTGCVAERCFAILPAP